MINFCNKNDERRCKLMDTIKIIPSSIIENFDSLHVADLTKEQQSLIIKHIALTREVIEANQLFDTFYYNLLNMRNSFTFNMDDTVFKTEKSPNYDNEYIAVNALVINLISSAKTLTEYLRNAANRWLGNDKDRYKDVYNKYVSNIYDTSFNYGLLSNLRNYMQHGNLPVSFQEGRYRFDAKQIIGTPHFDISGKLGTDMKKFIEKCEIPGENVPCLSLTLTISDYSLKFIDIYKKFLFYFKKEISSSYNEIQNLILNKPSIVCDYHPTLKGYIIYDCDDTFHTFNTNENPNKMMGRYEKKAADIYKEEKQTYEKMHAQLKFPLNIKF